jgi:cell division protein FtsB
MPSALDQIAFNIHPAQARTHRFHLKRTPRNWLALAGFHSRFLTWLGYESWFGRVVLHAMLYALVGKPVKPVQPPIERTASL